MFKRIASTCMSIALIVVFLSSFCNASIYEFNQFASNENKSIYEAINIYRVNNSKLPFSVMSSIQNASQIRSKELSSTTSVSHIRPNGSQWYTSLDECGFKYDNVSSIVEKYAISTSSYSSILNQLLNDQKTKALLLNSDFCHIGCSYSSNKNHCVELIFAQCEPYSFNLIEDSLLNDFFVNQSFEKSGKVLEVICEHGKSYVPVYDNMVSNCIIDKVGAQTVSINYGKITRQYDIYVNFSDVKINSWYYAGVTYCFDNGIFSGTSLTTFSPSLATSRAMFVTILAELDGANIDIYNTSSFSDVLPGKWYSSYVEWAYLNGIVSGVSDGIFSPSSSITREQLCVMIKNYIDKKEIVIPDATSPSQFKDDSKISSWAKESVAYCQRKGIVSGDTNGNFNPKNYATRAECSIIIYNLSKVLREL